ncbi:MAG: hypothetical protein ACOCYC_01580 [bacterium]
MLDKVYPLVGIAVFSRVFHYVDDSFLLNCDYDLFEPDVSGSFQ